MFIEQFFSERLGGLPLEQELRLTDPMVSLISVLRIREMTDYVQVLSSVVRWCWSRLPGGVVTWEAYELFCVGEQGK